MNTCAGNEIFNNAGTFRKSGGAGTAATISVVFANTGTVTNLIGILYFSGGGSHHRRLWHRRRRDHGI